MQRPPLPYAEIEWTIEPARCFESRQGFRIDDALTLHVEHGKATAWLSGTVFDLREAVAHAKERVIDLLLGIQLVDRTPYVLSDERVIQYGLTGERNFVILARTGNAKAIGHPADIACTDSNGSIIDTKRDRIKRKRLNAARISRHRDHDRPLQRMLRSFDSSVRDSDDELVHLWEIREAFRSRMGRDAPEINKAHQACGKKLDKLCNQAPLLEGRHRGQYPDEELKPATPEELRQARRAATELIEAYLEWLDIPVQARGATSEATEEGRT